MVIQMPRKGDGELARKVQELERQLSAVKAGLSDICFDMEEGEALESFQDALEAIDDALDSLSDGIEALS